MWRALVVLPAWLRGRTTHDKFSAFDWHHDETGVRARNRVGVKSHCRFTRFLVVGNNFCVNLLYECEFVCSPLVLRFLAPPDWSFAGVKIGTTCKWSARKSETINTNDNE